MTSKKQGKSGSRQSGSGRAQQVELRRVDTLTRYERNARTHSKAQIAELAASLAQFGMVGGIVVRKGVIAKGHGTLDAVMLLYETGQRLYPPPGQKRGAKPYPAGTVPVIDASGWTDDQFRAYVIADNRLGETSDWDLALLKLELVDIQKSTKKDPQLFAAIGFSDDDLAALDSDGTVTMEEPPESVKKNVATLAEIKAQRAKGNANVIEKTDTEKYLVIVYRSRAQREKVLKQLGLPTDERYVPGDSVEVRKRFAGAKFNVDADRPAKAAPANKAGAQG